MMLQPAAELEAIMQRTEEGMLAIAPCDSADYYFTEAIVPHRKVHSWIFLPGCFGMLNYQAGISLKGRPCFHVTGMRR